MEADDTLDYGRAELDGGAPHLAIKEFDLQVAPKGGIMALPNK